MKLTALLNWSKKEFSHLPWRKNHTLYRTLVSEIMLQQTTVSTVKNHFDRFIDRFPTIESLADATEEELLVAWKGLGYYRRARNLKKISEAIVNDFKGKFPTDLITLQKIPGIGPYTASAIVAIGMDRPALAVDANLERVIARLLGLKMEKGLKLQKEIAAKFEKKEIFQNVKSYRALNEALMDLGRTYCQARKASCELCHLSSNCLAFKESNPLKYPVESQQQVKAKADQHELHLLRVYVVKNGKILTYKKSDKEWLSGQYEVPTFTLESTDMKINQYPRLELNEKLQVQGTFKTGITKYKIKNTIVLTDEKFLKKINAKFKLEWRELTSKDSNLSTATLKGLEKLL